MEMGYDAKAKRRAAYSAERGEKIERRGYCDWEYIIGKVQPLSFARVYFGVSLRNTI